MTGRNAAPLVIALIAVSLSVVHASRKNFVHFEQMSRDSHDLSLASAAELEYESLTGNRQKIVTFLGLFLLSYLVAVAIVVGFGIHMFGPGTDDEEERVRLSSEDVATGYLDEDSEDEVVDEVNNQQADYSSEGLTASLLDKNKVHLTTAKNKREKLLRDAFKLHWLRECYSELLYRCAWTILYVSVGLLVHLCLKLYRQPTGYPILKSAQMLELTCVIVAAAVSVVCARYPKDIFYWPVFFFFCWYVPASNLPPFRLSCGQIAHLPANISESWYAKEEKEHKDCSLQGITAQTLILLAILLLPQLVPRVKMLAYFGWVLIFSYMIWTIMWNQVTGQRILSVGENAWRVILMSAAMGVAICKKFYMEKSHKNKFVHSLRHKHAVQKMFTYFKYMVPEHLILPMIMRPNEPIADPVDRCSILFIMICDFDQFAQGYSPQDLLRFLNENFSHFDRICEEQEVTKIETVGEEYVACVGVIPSDIAIAEELGHGAILEKLFHAADKIMKIQSSKVKFKMGMHTGPVVAGVIGKKLPRFRLFGDTINTAARMMQKSQTGKLQFGEETFKDKPHSIRASPPREVEMKGKGLVQTYFFESTPDRNTQRDPPKAAKINKRKSIFQMAASDDHLDDEPSDAAVIEEVENVCKSLSLHAFDNNDGGVASRVRTQTMQSEKTGRTQTMRSEKTGKTDFGDVLESVAKKNDEDDIANESKDWLDVKKLGGLLEQNLTPEMEQQWYEDYHVNRFCKKLDVRISRQIYGFAAITIAEVSYMIYQKSWEMSHPLYPGKYRLPIFLAFRLSICVIMFIWRGIVKTRWMKEQAFQGQSAFLLGLCLISVIQFISYEALTGSHPKKWEAPFDQFFSLNFVLLFYIMIGSSNILFKPSLVFIGLACLLMAISAYRDTVSLYFPFISKALFVTVAVINSISARDDQIGSRQRFRSFQQVIKTKQRIEGILNTLMPQKVVEELRKVRVTSMADDLCRFTPSHSFQRATIAQSDLCGFTKLAATRTPAEVVAFMSELFGNFDELTDKFGIYKVETVGDAYIAGMAEEPLTPTNSPISVIQFGLAMVQAVNEWAVRMGVTVKCRVGVHHGACVGGVVGNDMQRYHLFGNLMTGVEVLESTAPEGMVQVSQACKDSVDVEVKEAAALAESELLDETDKKNKEVTVDFAFEARSGEQLQTSKGEVHSYDEVGGRTFVIYPRVTV